MIYFVGNLKIYSSIIMLILEVLRDKRKSAVTLILWELRTK